MLARDAIKLLLGLETISRPVHDRYHVAQMLIWALDSALLTMLSTLPSFHTDPAASKILFGLDTTIVVLFTIE